jgi:hypothetical protein
MTARSVLHLIGMVCLLVTQLLVLSVLSAGGERDHERAPGQSRPAHLRPLPVWCHRAAHQQEERRCVSQLIIGSVAEHALFWSFETLLWTSVPFVSCVACSCSGCGVGGFVRARGCVRCAFPSPCLLCCADCAPCLRWFAQAKSRICRCLRRMCEIRDVAEIPNTKLKTSFSNTQVADNNQQACASCRRHQHLRSQAWLGVCEHKR